MKRRELRMRLEALSHRAGDLEIELAGLAAVMGRRPGGDDQPPRKTAAEIPSPSDTKPLDTPSLEGILEFLDDCEERNFILSGNPRAGRYGPRLFRAEIAENYLPTHDVGPPSVEGIAALWEQAIEDGLIVTKPTRNAARQATTTIVRARAPDDD